MNNRIEYESFYVDFFLFFSEVLIELLELFLVFFEDGNIINGIKYIFYGEKIYLDGDYFIVINKDYVILSIIVIN